MPTKPKQTKTKQITKPTTKLMTKPATESTIWTQINKFKDVIYIVTFAVTILTGYLTLKNDVKNLQKEVAENTVQLKKMNDILTDQQLLNGKIIQYMQMK